MGAPVQKINPNREEGIPELRKGGEKMKGILSLALLAAIATTAASIEMGNNNHHREKKAFPIIATVSGNTNHHRQRRSPGPPWALLALKSGGSGAGPLPPHVDPNIGQSSAQLNSMSTSASMSGPLATMGVLAILTSALMAANYFQAVNAKRRSGYAGQHFQKRSTLDINQGSIMSLINSFRYR